MFKRAKAMICIAMALLFAGASGVASAQDTRIRSVRVAASDVEGVARFYQAAFGLREVRRIDRNGDLFEIILNYGSTLEEAAASRSPRLVIILSKPDDPPPAVSNLIFGVRDIDGAIDRAIKAGGMLSRAVVVSPSSGAKYGFVKDPAGNEVELIEE